MGYISKLRNGGRVFSTVITEDDKASSIKSSSTTTTFENNDTQQYTTLAQPAPGSPFHFAFPVHDLNLAKQFYGDILGCSG